MAHIDNEIAKLPPSAEILEFYRQKIKEHDNVKEELLSMLEAYRKLGLSSVAEREREQLVCDLVELKTSLSDVNIFIHAERQQVSSLHLQNEKLKADQKMADKKLSFLLQVCGLSEDQLTAYLRSNNKKEILTKLSISKRREHAILLKNLKDTEPSEVELFLRNKVNLLEEHLASQQSSWEQEKNVLLEERLLQKAEAKAQRDHDQAHINLLNAKIEDAHRLNAESVQKTVEAKAEMLRSKNGWLAEKDKLMMDIQKMKRKLSATGSLEESGRSVSFGDLHNIQSTCELKQLKREISSLKREVREAEELKCLFETRSRKLEQEAIKLREQKEGQQVIYKSKLEKAIEARDLVTKQRDRAEERRKHQAEGFFSELKIVKNDLRKVVHQFFKLTRLYSESDQIPNVAEIQDLKLATTLARNIHHAIVEAKRNMVSIEAKSRNEEEK